MEESLEEKYILIADDSTSMHMLLDTVFDEAGYKILSAYDGVEAYHIIKNRHAEIKTLIVDWDMPRLNGMQMLRKISSEDILLKFPVIMVTSYEERDIIKQAFQLGVNDFLRKPFVGEELLFRVEAHLEEYKRFWQADRQRETLLNQLSEKLDELQIVKNSTIFGLAQLAESRDNDTGVHVQRIREYTRILAQALQERELFLGDLAGDYIENLYHMSALHDIGKVGVPDRILLKPGKLTTDEFAIMKEHAAIGGRTLDMICRQHANNEYLGMGRNIAYYHHEQWDGRGYPDGLRGNDIPLSARITAFADVFDALITKRVYKEAMEPDEVFRVMTAERETKFDPLIFDVFREVWTRFVQVSAVYTDEMMEETLP